MSFLSTTVMAPSGVFVSAGGYSAGNLTEGTFEPIYNPGVLEQFRDSFEVVGEFDYGSEEWFGKLSKVKCQVQDSDFLLYGEALTSISENVRHFTPDCSLGPLRGASKPCTLVEVMSRGGVNYDFFNYQEGHKLSNRPRVIGDLKPILLARNPENETYRINITDAACGGQGINALALILKEIKESTSEFKRQNWELRLDLLHDESADISNIEAVARLSQSGFNIQLARVRVPNLIFEDYDPALAFELSFESGRYLFKPCAKPGRMLLRHGETVSFIETENAGLMLEQLAAQGVTDYLINHSGRQQTGDVWADYQQKG
jgi:hypothetical protein